MQIAHTGVLASLPFGTTTGGALLLIAAAGTVTGAAVAARISYESFQRKGFRTRQVTTRLPATALREIFQRTVSGHGWSVVDQGNPMIAQRTPFTGMRQQIALHLDEGRQGTCALIAVVRHSRRALGGTTKAHALRWRMNAFLAAVRAADASACVVG